MMTFLLEKILPFPLYALSCRRLPAALSSQNKRNNEKQPSAASPILDQRLPQIGQFRCGKYSASYNGCAGIALYNAFLLKNCPRPLSSLIGQLEHSRCLSVDGKFGTNPYRINRVFKNSPLRCRRYHRISSLEAALQPGDAAVLTIWNDKRDLRKGAHFFTVLKKEDGYEVYNRLAAVEKNSLRAIVGGGNFIVGYRVY